MTTEEGIVTRIDNSTGWVKMLTSSACTCCSAKAFCISFENEEQREVETFNIAGAQIGDKVVIGLKTSSYLKISFLFFLFPTLSILLGAIIGEELAQHYLINKYDLQIEE